MVVAGSSRSDIVVVDVFIVVVIVVIVDVQLLVRSPCGWSGLWVGGGGRRAGRPLAAAGWAVAMALPWSPGLNVAGVGRGRGRSFSLDAFQIVGNLLQLADKTPADKRSEIANLFGMESLQRGYDAAALVAGLTCLNVKTVRGIYTSLQSNQWSGEISRSFGTQRMMPVSSSSANLELGCPLAIGSTDAERLSERPLPPAGSSESREIASESEESDFGECIAAKAPPPGRWRPSLRIWRDHLNYPPAIRMAQLATFWITSGLPQRNFASFVAWANSLASDGIQLVFGNTNHTHHFIDQFAFSLADAIRYSACAGLHTRLPATGLPSDLTRIIDIVTIGGVGLLVILFIQTDSQGNLIWNIVDCCPVEQCLLAVGSKRGNFRFHSAEQLVQLVHQREAVFKISKGDRARRVVRTVADGAIAGPNSAKFVKHECAVDGVAFNPLKEGVCAFHSADNAFAASDRQFPEARCHDCFLRLVRTSFAFGTGRLILRAVAREFGRIAGEALTESDRFMTAATKAETEGRDATAKRCLFLAAEKRAEAHAIRRAGWDHWRRPLAPQEDGTRKVVWQSAARARIYQQYGLIYWGLRVRMYEARENACLAAIAKGSTPTARTGMNTKNMRAWRALGRTLVDINLLVFNCGRSDFRTKHTVAFTLMAQSSLKAGASSTMQAAVGAGMDMLNSIGALVAMSGIVRMMEQLLRAPQWVVTPRGSGSAGKQEYGPVVLKNYTLWATMRTLLSHNCWRHFPTLSNRLPEILLGGTFCGVPLHTKEFAEHGTDDPQLSAVGGSGHATTQKKADILKRRDQRFTATLAALSRLLLWARSERRSLMQRLLGWAPGGKLIFQESDGLPRVNCDLDLATQFCNASGLQQDEEDEGDEGNDEEVAVGSESKVGPNAKKEVQERKDNITCSFAPPHKRHRSDSAARDDLDTALNAAVKLADDCAHLQPQPPLAFGSTEAEIFTTIAAEAVDAHESIDAAAESESDSEEEEKQTPAAGSRPLPAAATLSGKAQQWVVKKLVNSRFHCMPWLAYSHLVEQEMWKHVDANVAFQMHIDRVFGPHLMEEHGRDPKDVEMSLTALYNEFNGRLWGLAAGSIPRDVDADPPAEVYAPCSCAAFIEQYRHLREWAYGFRRLPYAGEFFKVSSYILRKMDDKGNAYGSQWTSSPEDIREAGRWQHHIARPGTVAHSRRFGRCIVVDVVSEVIVSKVYAYVMTTPLAEIRSLGLWNIVVAFHRCIHIGRPSEALAETVGSILNFMQKKWSGTHPMGTQFLVNATLARASGLRGVGGEEGILATALNIHFRCKGPEGWHFVQRSRPLAIGAATKKAALKNVVHRSKLPLWVDALVVDLWKQRKMNFAKILPRPLKMALTFHEDDDNDAQATLPASSSRRNMVAAGRKAYEPNKLADDVFRKLNITALSLPGHLRPGKHFR